MRKTSTLDVIVPSVMAFLLRRVSWASFAVVLLGVATARADGESNRVAAEALFAEGRRLLGAGDFSAACQKLEASQRLDPGIGTLLNLGDCYEKKGASASAWASFLEAAAGARRVGDVSREQTARERAARLERALSHLTVTVPSDSASQIVVVRDGHPVDRVIWGTPTPIDPGKHVIEASAPGKKTWSKTVDVGKDGQSVEITVPYLESDPTSAPPSPAPIVAPATVGPSAANDTSDTKAGRPWRARRWARSAGPKSGHSPDLGR